MPYGNAQVMEFINNLQFNLYFHFRKILKNTFACVSAAWDFHFEIGQIFSQYFGMLISFPLAHKH